MAKRNLSDLSKYASEIPYSKNRNARKPRGSDGSAMAKKWADPIWEETMLKIRKENKKEIK